MDNLTWRKAGAFTLWGVYLCALLVVLTAIPVGYVVPGLFLGLIPFKVRLVHEKSLNDVLRELQRAS